FPGYIIRVFDDGALINHSDQPSVAINNGSEANEIPYNTSAHDVQDVEDALLNDRFALIATQDLKVGDELYIEPLDNEVAQDRRFTFDISFNAPGIIEGEPAIKTLKDMSNLVGSIIDTFEPFFT
ncbi:MAG: hypothetical protein IH788_06730, partial [Nitrospinae bacterium]|nr:hypothetical protein [Nitrospinota bacterium]